HRSAGPGFRPKPASDSIGKMTQRGSEDLLFSRLPTERGLGSGRLCSMMRPDLPRITIPRERHELLSGRAASYSLKRRSRHLRQLSNGVNTDLGEPRASDGAYSPHQVDRQVVKEIQLGFRIDDQQPVRLSHLRGNFREVLGARHTN